LLFDLDGPVLDVRARHWAVHRYCLRELGLVNCWPRSSALWSAKRRRASLGQLLGVSNDELLSRYTGLFRRHIEGDHFLALDVLQPAIESTLTALGDRARLLLVTMRQRSTATRASLCRLGVLERFESLYIVRPTGSKGTLFRKLRRATAGPIVAIGDTEVDGEAARGANIPFIAVTYGIRRAAWLEPFAPIARIANPRHLHAKLAHLLNHHGFSDLEELKSESKR
jgi:phosphoglycolate phosphatase-like HAD superfamily hydrolase